MGIICDSDQVDHINGNTFDNRRSNLRKATTNQNAKNKHKNSRNTSGYRGVSYYKQLGKWKAQIQKDGVKISIGYYDDIHVAADMFDRAAIELHGEFACLNFPGAGGR